MNEIEPVAAERIDEGDCDYNDCGSDAEYLVELRAGRDTRATTKMCDDCSQTNRIWVKENGLLDREVTVRD